MIRAALASAALPGEPPETVLQTALGAGFKGVEWFADGFLELGDKEAAGGLMMQTLRAGLCSVSYASSFRFGIHDHGSFIKVLDTAAALHVPLVRVWTGPPGVGTGSVDAEGRADREFADEILRLADKAGELGISLCLGFAKGSMLHSYDSAVRLFSSLDHPFVKLVWELLAGSSFDTAREAFSSLSGRIGLVLARSTSDQAGREGLAAHAEDWLEYLDAYDEQGGSPDMVRHVLVQSIRDGNTTMLAEDAACIADWSCQLRHHHKRRVY
jgi:sugar phosphate isomerase/epimerase